MMNEHLRESDIIRRPNGSTWIVRRLGCQDVAGFHVVVHGWTHAELEPVEKRPSQFYPDGREVWTKVGECQIIGGVELMLDGYELIESILQD